MNLNTYRESPVGLHHLVKLDEICNKRIVLYRILESAKPYKEGSVEWSRYVTSKIISSKLDTYKTLLSNEPNERLLECRDENNRAHWMLGLCYCQTEFLQKCFIEWETELFHLLYMHSKKSEIKTFLNKNNLVCSTVDVSEKLIHSKDLALCTEVDAANIEDTDFYKTNFYDVLEILARRECYLKEGIAIFSENNYVYYVKNVLSKEFLLRLRFNKKVFPSIDKRILGLMENIKKFTPGIFISGEVENVNLTNIDQVAQTHFPLCMKYLHDTLRSIHHLKYHCRMQYGVFLYWLGLSSENALEFWKQEFIHDMTEEMFNKKYAYLFKHQYGLVGRKQPYNSYTCTTILNFSPSPSQRHGCPFKLWSKDAISRTLQENVCNLTDIEDLIDRSMYQKACRAHLYGSKNIPYAPSEGIDDIVLSPNQYALDSFKLLENADILDSFFEDETA